MSCNANNHSAGCDCGFGGSTTHSVGPFKRYESPRAFIAIQPIVLGAHSTITKFETFTVPNARCPVCGDEVFFYRSQDGGRVFFDELGPPWPKHPCTDNPAVPGLGLRSFETRKVSLKPVAPAWAKSNWLPLSNVVTRILKDGDALDDEDKTILIGVILGHPSGRTPGCVVAIPGEFHIELAAPVYARLAKNGAVEEISCLSGTAKDAPHGPSTLRVFNAQFQEPKGSGYLAERPIS